ncbi:hypothetical protein [Actinacidiphila glaucinigra]|uniref:hypothetical protein n=1 Tax=Actinacidiphila glaucinigra TaxID=235986 RepID=UPI00366E86A5
MATRFWLTNTSAQYTPTTKRGTWNDTTISTGKLLGRKPQGSSATAVISETSLSTYNVMQGRWISPPAVKAGTLSGTVAWVTGRSQSNAAAAMVVRAHMFVTAGDTDTLRGTLLSNYTGSTVFSTTGQGAGTLGTAITSVALQVGDRIVVEFGYQAQNTVSTSYGSTLWCGGTNATDLTIGATTVTTTPGWVEFSGADGLFSTPFATIVDTFSTGISTQFDSWGGTAWNPVTKRAAVAANDQYPGLMASTGFEMTGTTFYAEAAAMPTGGSNASFSAVVLGPTDNGTLVRTKFNGGTLLFESCVSYTDASPVTLPYDPVAHRWWRFREAAGTFYWETSPDAATWTVRRSLATPQWLKTAGLRINFEGYSDTGNDATAAEVDNINSVPGASVVKAWSGSAWVQKPVKVWTGSAWVAKPARVWSGSTWR